MEPFNSMERWLLKHFVHCNRSLVFKSQQDLYFFPEINALKKKWLIMPNTAYYLFYLFRLSVKVTFMSYDAQNDVFANASGSCNHRRSPTRIQALTYTWPRQDQLLFCRENWIVFSHALPVFFMNQFTPNPWVNHKGRFEFFENSRRFLQLKVRHRCKWKRSSIRKVIIIFLGHLWVVEINFFLQLRCQRSDIVPIICHRCHWLRWQICRRCR